MARPRQTGDSFSRDDLAIAAGLTKRAVQHIAEAKLLSNTGDIKALKEIATTGGFVAAGVPLFNAARLTNAILAEFPDGELPSGLEAVAKKEATAKELAALPTNPNDYWYHQAIVEAERRQMREILKEAEGKSVEMNGAPLIDDDYWAHVARMRERREYYSGLVSAMRSDVRIEICDRRHIFMWPTSRLKTFAGDRAWMRDFREKHPSRPGTEPAPVPGFVGWVENWERDADMRVVHVSKKLPMTSKTEASAARLDAQIEVVRMNAIGIITVNVSLAIRRALDRLAEFRATGVKA